VKAFIPVSISTELFSSSRMIDGLGSLPKIYSEYYFLVGDVLQMYNDASDARKDPHSIFKLWSERPSKFFAERSVWIKRLEDKFNLAHVTILSVDDLTDSKHHDLLRNLYILYNLDDSFKSDVDLTVSEAIDRRHYHRSHDTAKSLSLMYVLEEVALNLRLRHRFQVYDEFYLGPPLVVLVELLSGRHSWFLREIGFCNDYDTHRARFFSWGGDENRPSWIQHTTGDRFAISKSI
jgi:hypothetical protein